MYFIFFYYELAAVSLKSAMFQDHIVGKHRSLIKLSFQSTEGLNKAGGSFTPVTELELHSVHLRHV